MVPHPTTCTQHRRTAHRHSHSKHATTTQHHCTTAQLCQRPNGLARRTKFPGQKPQTFSKLDRTVHHSKHIPYRGGRATTAKPQTSHQRRPHKTVCPTGFPSPTTAWPAHTIRNSRPAHRTYNARARNLDAQTPRARTTATPVTTLHSVANHATSRACAHGPPAACPASASTNTSANAARQPATHRQSAAACSNCKNKKTPPTARSSCTNTCWPSYTHARARASTAARATAPFASHIIMSRHT